MQEYTPEEKKDIVERTNKAIETLKELQLNPSAQIIANNVGDDTFGFKVIPYLADLKFAKTYSELNYISKETK